MIAKVGILAAAAFVPTAIAQSGVWQQCGGLQYDGPTTCVAGTTCVYVNDFYFQCQPGVASTLTTTSKAATTTSKVATTTTTKPATSTTTKAATSTTTTKPPATTLSTTTKAASSTTAAPPVSISGNPFAGVQGYANPYYSSEVYTLAIPSLTGTLVAKASAVAKVPSFVWLDTAAKVPTVDTYLTNIEALNKAGASPPIAGQFVVYDLPDRDCAALASNGEYSIANNGVANYKAYVDAIAAAISKHPSVKVLLVIEPDSIANLITNLNVPKCSNAAAAYKECVTYALSKLNLPNVSQYIDAGHAGWLGWPANIGPAATLYASVYKAAGSPASVRGIATNVANYNAFTGACASYTSGNPNCNEQLYINAFGPMLEAAGFPAHFIVDTSRNGVQPTQQLAWGDWCNVIGTGFGVRPTTNTGNALVDAFAWVKPGAESDGTSDTSAVRYDAHCGLADALKPAPEAGKWFQAYFVQLLTNANPSF